MDRWVGKIAVVTGASSGIGLAITKTLVKHGVTVIGLARNKSKMEMNMKDVNGPGKFYPRKCDVSIQQNVMDTFHWIKKDVGIVQILVNNAGTAISGTLCETSRSDWEHVFNVNVMGLLDCTKLVVKMMQETEVEGHIININSVQGHRVYNFEILHCNVYSATKYAVTALSETLRNDLASDKIRVTSISPGAVDTEILQKNGFNIPMSQFRTLTPESIGEAVIYALSTPQSVEVTELTIRPTGERRK